MRPFPHYLFFQIKSQNSNIASGVPCITNVVSGPSECITLVQLTNHVSAKPDHQSDCLLCA